MLPASPDTGAPSVLGKRYEILSPLGFGSAATVFKVHDRRSGELRAAKVLRPENAAVPEILARFEDEFRILRTLHHPHLPAIYDYGWTDDGGRYLVMELVEGEPLGEYFRAHPDDIWVILYQLCEALTFVHAKNLLHQDIKPSNILVARTSAYGAEMPLVKLIDFGLTYRRDTGAAVQLVGTPEYVAPEVVKGEAPLTRAVDYYSLGASLYELLCDRPPFTGTATVVLRAQVEREPLIEEEHLQWAELYPHVRALLTKDRKARLEAFEEFRRAIVSRLTGGIEELDRAYGLARIESLPMIGKDEVWKELMGWLEGVLKGKQSDQIIVLRGQDGLGKGLLVDRTYAECLMRGATVWRFGSNSDYPSLIDESLIVGPGRFDAYAKSWRDLDRMAENGPIVLMIDGHAASEGELGYLRFVMTQFELMQAQQQHTRIFMLLVGDTTSWPKHLGGGREIQIAPFSTFPRSAIVEGLRGEFAEPSDARRLAESIGNVADSGSALDMLTTGVLTSALVFAGWRWKVEGHISPRAQESPQTQLGEMPTTVQGLPFEILTLLACHDGPLSTVDIICLTGAKDSAVREAVASICRSNLAWQTAIDGAIAVATPKEIGRLVLNSLAVEERRSISRRFLRLLARAASGPSANQRVTLSLSHHYAVLGQSREAARLQVSVIREARRRRDFEVIERICEVQVRQRSGSLETYYLKQWIDALWERNQHARTYFLMDELFLRRGRRVPIGLVPRFVKGMSDAVGPRAALNRARYYNKIHDNASESAVRLQIEKAFLLLTLGANNESITQLRAVLLRREVLRDRDHLRALIYLAMNFVALGQLRRATPILSRAARLSMARDCVDEYALANTVSAQLLTMRGDPNDVLGLCARTIRFARDNGLDFRRNVLYRLAASAYHDLGDTRRARRYQEQAIRLASALGLREFEAMSWARLAHYESAGGRFGNALRYVGRALVVIGEGSSVSHRTQAQILRLWLHTWLRSSQAQRYIRSARKLLRSISNVNEKGRLCLVLGQYCMDSGDLEDAQKLYSRASALFRDSGFVDNRVTALRAQLKLNLLRGKDHGIREIYEQICALRRVVTSRNAILECGIAVLEYHFARRTAASLLHREVNICESLCGSRVDMTLQLDALVVMFRVAARNGDVETATSLFDRIVNTARGIAANVGHEHAAGLASRLGLDSLRMEVRNVRRKWEGRTHVPAFVA